jgi:hypothetical protein
VRSGLLLLLLLIPSAHYAWKNRDIPGFGKLQDDALLFSSAKGLAAGEGFTVLSLPEKPAQTKYPVLYPLYLAAVWRIDPSFPDNLKLATLCSWLVLAVCLGLALIFWLGEGLGEVRTWIVMALLAFSPYMILFGCSLFSEVFFTCWLLAALIVARRDGIRMALFAGALAGLAYLSRTAGIALIVSMPAWYLWRRESRRTLAFAAGMLPFILGWSLWSAAHKYRGASPTIAYYTDYLKFQLLNVGFDNLAVVLWKNADALLYSMGSLILPPVVAILPVKILTQVIAIAMICGIVRMARRGVALPYALFALVSSLMLVIWHFPSTERFVLPLFPLLAAGLVVELDHLVQMLRVAFRHKDVGQRVVAAGFAAVVVSIFGGALAVELFVTFGAMPETARTDRAKLQETRATYSWISQNVPASAGILSADDPLLYLYTGHPGNSAPLLSRWWYAAEYGKFADFYKDVVPYCRERGFDYILATSLDVSRWTGGAEDSTLMPGFEQNPELERLYQSPSGASVYRVRQPPPTRSSEH